LSKTILICTSKKNNSQEEWWTHERTLDEVLSFLSLISQPEAIWQIIIPWGVLLGAVERNAGPQPELEAKLRYLEGFQEICDIDM
jgi:hypothetical protein